MRKIAKDMFTKD